MVIVDTLRFFGTALKEGTQIFFKGAKTLVTDTQGLEKISYVAQAYFELIENTTSQIPEPVPPLTNAFKTYTNALIFVSIVKRLKDFTCPDDKNKMIWQRSWDVIATTVSLAASNVFTFATYLNDLKLIQLGKTAAKMGVGSGICLLACCAFDTVTCVKSLSEIDNKITKARNMKRIWRMRSELKKPAILKMKRKDGTPKKNDEVPSDWKKLIKRNITKWQGKLGDTSISDNDREHATDRLNHWYQLRECRDLSAMKRYCQAKVNRWDVALRNQKKEMVKTWISIAVNVSYVALIAIALAFSVPAAGIAATSLAIFGLCVSATDLTNFLLGAHWNQPLPNVPVPQ